MKTSRLSKLAMTALGAACMVASYTASPDDIDIFTSGSGAAPENPNVLIIIDNTSNWARQSQQWPEKDASGQSLQQGQSEVRAISTALSAVDSSINIGMMEFVTGGTANNTGGFVRQDIVPMTTTNINSFRDKLATIFNNINDPVEKRNANTQYGDLMYDAYNYFAGLNHTSGSSTPSDGSDVIDRAYTPSVAIGDRSAYTNAFTTFKSPLSASKNCAHTFIIFIANPNSSGPANDTSYNDGVLASLPTPTVSRDLPRPDVTVKFLTKLGYTSACYTSQAACSTSDFGSQCQAAKNGCFCDSNDTITALPGCINGLRYNVVGTNTTTTHPNTTNGGTSSCYTSSANCNTAAAGSEHGGMTCPPNTDTGAGTNPRVVDTYTCSYGCGTTGGGSCANTAGTTVAVSSTCTSGGNCSSLTNSCYGSATAASISQDKGLLTCPTGSTCSYSWSTPSSSSTGKNDSCAAGTAAYTVTQTATAQQATTTTCYSAQASCNSSSDHAGQTCPTGSSSDTGAGVYPRTQKTIGYSCSYACASSGSQNSCADSVNPAIITTSSTSTSSSTTTAACQTTCNASDHPGLTCPATTSTDSWNGASTGPFPRTQTTTTHSCSFACGSQVNLSCTGSKTTAGPTAGTPVTNSTTSLTNSCYKVSGSQTPQGQICPSGTGCSDTGSLSCATDFPSTTSTSGDTTTTTTYTCNYSYNTPSSGTQRDGTACPTSGNPNAYTVTETATPSTTVVSYTQHKYGVTMTDTATTTTTTTPGNNNYNFPVTQSATATTNTTYTPGIANFTFGVVQNVSATETRTGTTVLGNTFSCYASAAAATTSDYSSLCGSYSGGCAIDANSGGTSGNCPAGARYAVQAVPELPEVVAVSPAHSSTPPTTTDFNADEWAKYMHTKGIPVPAGSTNYQKIATYTIDVYYQSPDKDTTSLLMNMANVSGGKYYAAHSEQQIVDALKQILTEIQAVNSAFASASLPVNATNRAQDKNQVFIGMFRPTKDATPKWFGNLKQYQLIIGTTGNIDLGDSTGKSAISSTTGFINDCAAAYWSTDSGTYWSFSDNGPNNVSNDAARSGCKTASTDPFSDLPDGPLVEKGAAAEVVRNGNNPPATTTTPTYLVNRNLKTLPNVGSTGPLTAFNSTTVPASTLSNSLVDFITGVDNTNPLEKTGNSGKTRPSIHGDVVHSRPQPVDYGGTTGVVVYYGANDGILHAVRATDGKELWGFVPPEFYNDFQRLQDNCPLILYPSKVSPPNCTAPSDLSTKAPIPKRYFMDGSVGLYEDAATPPNVWIFPSMRRGGRMIYALDVTDPTTPVFKWKFGCPDLNDNTGCISHSGDITPAAGAPTISEIGQSWPTPDVSFIKGYDPDPTVKHPVIVLGGGGDGCEDTNSATPGCSSSNGRGVYVIDATDGTLLATFRTDRSVVADTALLDLDFDGKADFAYIADTGGSIYRINFIDPVSRAVWDKTQWTITKVAHTTGSGRKFQFQPALVQASGTTIYLALGSGDREHPLICQYPFPTASAGTNTCPTGAPYPFAGVTNRFYVFKDYLTSATASDFNLDDTTGTIMLNRDGNPGCSATPVLPGSDQPRGWFKDLNVFGPGEQTVTSAVVAGGLVFFSTNRPIPPSAQSCSNTLGDAKGYKVNLLTGSGALNSGSTCGGSLGASFLGGGLPPSPVMATVPIGGSGVKTVIIGAVQDDPGSRCAPGSCPDDGSGGGIQSEIGAQETKPNIKSKRRPVYWKKSGTD